MIKQVRSAIRSIRNLVNQVYTIYKVSETNIYTVICVLLNMGIDWSQFQKKTTQTYCVIEIISF